MLRLCSRASRVPWARARSASAGAGAGVTVETYHNLANLTMDSIQEVYEDEADDDPDLAMEVECAVRCSCRFF